MYKVLQESDPLPNPLENVPIAPNDGTEREDEDNYRKERIM